MPEFQKVIKVANLNGSTGFGITGGAGPVSDAGDVNGDGFDDLIIAGDVANYVVFGKASNFADTLDLSTLNGKNGFKTINQNSGQSISGAGDVNGDGFDDVIIGSSGASYVVFGKASRFAASFDLSTLDGGNGFKAVGNYNAVVSGAGDVNSDGFDDVIVAEPDRERAYVVLGKASDFDAIVDLTTLTPYLGNYSTGFGRSVSNAGDVNGDGFDDIIIGAPLGTTYRGEYPGLVVFISPATGSAHIWGAGTRDFLGTSVSSAGDFNGDGFDDVITQARRSNPDGAAYIVFGAAGFTDVSHDVSDLDGNNGLKISVPMIRSVSSAGDVNGDGFDDVIIGTDSGKSYVVFGKASGFSPIFDVATLDGDNGFEIRGGGPSVSNAGDVNGDGFDDLIVGGSHVMFGHRALNAVIRIGTDIAQTMNGGRGDDRIDGLDGDDALIGWELSDTIDGGDGSDLMKGGSGGDVFIVSEGEDTANGSSGSDRLDFTRLDSAQGLIVNLNKGIVSLPGGLGSIAFSSVERVTGNDGDDKFTGTAASNSFRGLGGDDSIAGGAGNDLIFGGAGNDTLIGGTGRDELTGGGGLDMFAYDDVSDSTIASSHRDTITDFDANNADRIDLLSMDAIAGGANSKFTFIGTEAFTGPGQVRFFQQGANTFVEMNTADDLTADMGVKLLGLVTLDQADFVL